VSDEFETLRAKLHGETAKVGWEELERFFARGMLVHVDAGMDLVTVAESMAEDDCEQFQRWMDDGVVGRLSDTRAREFSERRPDLWAVVVAPWILVQERVIH